MHPPCELMVEEFLPAMRAIVARKLHSEGFSQSKIAVFLGITQASVSLYLAQEHGGQSRSLAALGVSPESAERYGALLSEDVKKSPVYAVNTLYSIWSDLLGRGEICQAHRSEHPSLAQCEMCLRVFGAIETGGSEAIELVSRAVAMLEASDIFVHIMPEVSVNIAYAHGDASAVRDVVAVPGRIVRVRDRPRSLMRPEFGASTHLASVLLEVRRRVKGYRAAMNVRYDEKMREVLGGLNLSILELGGYDKGADPVVEALTREMGRRSSSFDVVVDPGGSRIEPSLYLFANDPVEVARLSLKIAHLYSLGS